MAQQISDLRGTREERSLGDLFGDLSRETTNLIRQEMTLAKVELTGKAARMGKDAGILAAGGALVYAGLLALITAAIIGLAQAWAWWLSALVIGIIVVGVGGVMVLMGLKAMRQAGIVPTQTVQTLKEDAQWAKNQIR
ncbi:MAG TPA: phage holin family protein [Chloroflexota bacterium]|nr:phage holin family protein [Chloroflexota bacterium]